MAAGLGALRDDGIDAVLLEPDRLLHDGRRRDHDAAGRLDALEQRLVRQAEMEAHDFRLQFLDQFAHRGVERSAVGGVDRRRRIEPQFLVIRREPLLPLSLALGVGVDRLVAKEIHIDRRRHPLPDDIDLLARLLHRQ